MMNPVHSDPIQKKASDSQLSWSKKQQRPFKVAIVWAQFNPKITQGLLFGAKQVLSENGIEFLDSDLYSAPGAFEIPLIAKHLAESTRYDGVICLGCVIKGDTAHFEFISLGTTIGLIQAMLLTNIPITFGILTTYKEEQALVRAQKDAHNKGREAALACLESLKTIDQIRLKSQ